MSISKIRVRSAVSRNNNNNNHHETATTSANSIQSKSSPTAARDSAKTSGKKDKESPKVLQKQKSSKILPLSATNASTAKLQQKQQQPPTIGTAAIAAGLAGLQQTTTATSATLNTAGCNPTAMSMTNHSSTTSTSTCSATTTTTIPQATTSLLKIEPFVPSLVTRSQKPMRRSYSTLSTTNLKKRLHSVNTNLAVNLGIANHHHQHHHHLYQQYVGKTAAGPAYSTSSIVQGTTIDTTANSSSNLPKVTGKQSQHNKSHPHLPAPLRRRQPLRGPINRQRSKSTSSSNSNSNRPNTSLVTATAPTPTLGTPCTPPHNAVVIPQPNGICRIQRNAKEQEKLPDRINYDKRGLTAIPIFENEPNLRLLSLQHNLINTFHIPKEVKSPNMEDHHSLHQINSNNLSRTCTDNSVSGTPAATSGLTISNKTRFPLPLGSPNHEHTQQPPSHLVLHNLANTNHNHVNTGGGFGAYMLQRNKLLHRSINLNNVNLQQPSAPTTTAPSSSSCSSSAMRLGMRKSKSFVNNFNLQYQINKRALQNPRASYLKKSELAQQLKSFDSSTSASLTTESVSSTNYLNGDIAEEEDMEKIAELEIKNKQLLINYGTIFSNLVFLDLYDNQIERINNLDGLTSLTVLLLGKNRISDISGLASLKSTLRVLDLHGNKLCSIANKINCLKELKSLNLAGNQIRQINHNDFMGLANLKELNLKRNKLKRINGFQHLCSLERLWLCHNDLHKVDDMASIAQAYNVIEITIENNPVSLAGDCVSFLVSHLPKLQSLSQMPITEQVRKAAMTWRSNKELSEQSSQQGNKEAFNLIRREEIISNARTNWELLRSQQMLHHHGMAPANSVKGPLKASKRNQELEKITEANEQSYEEFIKLPPIEPAQEKTDKDKDERNSSASSLGPNVNSSSSCYTSADEEDQSEQKNSKKSTPNQEQSQPKDLKSLTNDSSSLAALPWGKQSEAVALTMSCCTPTLTIQFPLESTANESKMSNLAQNQNPNQTSLINASTSTSSSMMTVGAGTTTAAALTTTTTVSPTAGTSSTPSSPHQYQPPSSPSPSPALTQQPGLADRQTTSALCKRYMTGSLMRSQTIVGTGGCHGGGYAIKANANATAATATATATNSNINILRYHPAKLNPANTTAATATATAAALTAQQQTAMGVGGASPHHVMPSSCAMNGHHVSSIATMSSTSILNANKTSISSSSNANNISNTTAGSTATGAAGSSGAGATSTKLTAIEREREQGGDYLIEICGRYLNIYGQGALRFIDKQWNPTKANDVHTLNFSYINFNNITAILSRIKVRFPHAEHFVFRETNIHCLGQLNSLAELQGITSVFIDPEGNPLTAKDLWRQYAIYRLSHWGLKTLNAIEVTPEDVEQANSIYAGLSDLILWSMPDAMLQPLLTRLRLDESCTASKMLPKQWLQKPDNRSLRLVVGKEALQWKKSPPHQQHQEAHILPTPQQIRLLQAQFLLPAGGVSDTNQQQQSSHHHHQSLLMSSLSSPWTTTNATTSLSSSLTGPTVAAAASSALASNSANGLSSSLTQRERGKIHFTIMMENTCHAVEKLHKLEQLWPMMLLNIVRNTLLDYSQLDVYIRDLMAEIMK